MIVNIRGTGGAGKSTLVRSIMERFEGGERVEHHVEGRKQPLYYTLSSEQVIRPLMVIGHYNTACGGCDTVKTTDQVYELLRTGIRTGFNVLYEGIMVMDDVRRAIEVSKEDTLRVLYLTTDIEECLRRIRSRREARGDVRPLSEKNTRTRKETAERNLLRLSAAGVHVERLDCQAALARCCQLLGC